MEMFKSKKSLLTCSNCCKIFKDPVDLPCGDSICREHLSSREVVKENRIKCTKCNEEFQVTCDEFRSNKTLRKLIEDQSHLNGEEISLKLELEDSMRTFFEFYDAFIQNRTKLASDVFDRFQEIRSQIDEHCEELKKRIDDIALTMIAETKKHEETYLKELKEKFSSFDETQLLENKLNAIEETFRHPNLQIEAIKEMQSKQEESLNDIQLKLNELTKIKDDLKEKNEFQPNKSLFNQKVETSLFGLIKLDGYWLNFDPFKSEILIGERQSFELIELCEFSPNDKWSLLYRATRDGFGSDVFHSRCNWHSNTLTILKAKESKFIFGGFTTVDWDSSSGSKSDPNAFIFSLTNKDKTPLKMKVDPNYHQYGIYCISSCGPSFGKDIHIANNSNTTIGSHSKFGITFRHPQYEYGTMKAEKFLSGSFNFQLDEIEVYQKE